MRISEELAQRATAIIARIRTYLDYSTRKMQGPLKKIRGKGLDALTPEEEAQSHG